MYKIFEFIGTIIISTGIAVFVVKVFFEKLIGSSIGNYFNKQLEDHKHELSLASESARFDFQRKIRDFSLYAEKKHEIYIALHKLVLDAHGRIFGLIGLVRMPDLTEYDRKDIDRFLIKEHLSRKKKR